MATVLVDAENVRRSVWPNIPRRELEQLCAAWAASNGHDAVVVWETAESADDRIALAVRELPADVWVVSSDRGLRQRVDGHAARMLGGGAFAHELVALRR